MRKGTLFWAFILILVGVLLLLNNLGLLTVNVWELIGPFFLILLGLWVLWGVFFARSEVETEAVTIPLDGAAQARIQVQHGAGRLRVGGDAAPGELVAGTFGGGLDRRVEQVDERMTVEMRIPSTTWSDFAFPWMWGPKRSLDWTFDLSSEIPLALAFETGAGEARLDLTGLRVTDLRLQTGASSTHVMLPANAGHTQARIEAGAASVVVTVPPGVAARIRTGGGLTSINVDRERFPRSGDVYQSPDYETASNKVDVSVEAGVGSIMVE